MAAWTNVCPTQRRLGRAECAACICGFLARPEGPPLSGLKVLGFTKMKTGASSPRRKRVSGPGRRGMSSEAAWRGRSRMEGPSGARRLGRAEFGARLCVFLSSSALDCPAQADWADRGLASLQQQASPAPGPPPRVGPALPLSLPLPLPLPWQCVGEWCSMWASGAMWERGQIVNEWGSVEANLQCIPAPKWSLSSIRGWSFGAEFQQPWPLAPADFGLHQDENKGGGENGMEGLNSLLVFAFLIAAQAAALGGSRSGRSPRVAAGCPCPWPSPSPQWPCVGAACHRMVQCVGWWAVGAVCGGSVWAGRVGYCGGRLSHCAWQWAGEWGIVWACGSEGGSVWASVAV